jgi:hypothetical protein
VPFLNRLVPPFNRRSPIHTQFITPGGGAERAANAILLIHFSRYVLVSLKPIQSKSSLHFTVPFGYYLFADSPVLAMSAASLKAILQVFNVLSSAAEARLLFLHELRYMGSDIMVKV